MRFRTDELTLGQVNCRSSIQKRKFILIKLHGSFEAVLDSEYDFKHMERDPCMVEEVVLGIDC